MGAVPTETRRHILLVGEACDSLETVAPMLHRAEFEVHRVEPSEEVLGVVQATRFELLVVAYPLQDLPLTAVLDSVRATGSACRGSSFLVLAEPESVDEALCFVHRGANRVVARDWAGSRMWLAFSDLLEVAPRIEVRADVVLEVRLDAGPRVHRCRSENLSRSGILVRTPSQVELGCHLDLQIALPDHLSPVEGSAQTVRWADTVSYTHLRAHET